MTEMLNYRKEQLELLAEQLFLTAGIVRVTSRIFGHVLRVMSEKAWKA